MTKKNIGLFILVLIGLGLVTQLCILPTIKYNTRRQQQEVLARQLGVKIEDYSDVYVFPEAYFYAVLKPGMTLDQAHAIVRGYEKVYNCFGTDEIYYYFNTNDDNALRFVITYNDQLQYEDMRGEDLNERTIGIGPKCADGLLKQKYIHPVPSVFLLTHPFSLISALPPLKTQPRGNRPRFLRGLLRRMQFPLYG